MITQMVRDSIGILENVLCILPPTFWEPMLNSCRVNEFTNNGDVTFELHLVKKPNFYTLTSPTKLGLWRLMLLSDNICSWPGGQKF